MDPSTGHAIVAGALADEPPLPRRMDRWLERTLADEPWPHIVGDLRDRGGPNGVVYVGAEEVLRWGDPERSEMVFSIAKSALATVAGLAYDDGRLTDLDEPVVERVPLRALGVPDGLGEGEPEDPSTAAQITWRHLLTQTSDWRGTLYQVPWWADPQGKQRPEDPPVGPGQRFAYNDVRTNLCSLALTHLHGASNEMTLSRRIMTPIGAHRRFSWRGLRTMRTTLADGATVAVTTGGSHWGGGLWCSATELARFGRLHLDGGVWQGRRLLSQEWCELMLTPTRLRPAYGLMWWRNAEGFYPGCGERGFAAHGTGEQLVWCDPERDLVAVVRWAADPVATVAALTAAIDGRA
jgi:CubicO group peptidase (beta-lactamase class C family)